MLNNLNVPTMATVNEAAKIKRSITLDNWHYKTKSKMSELVKKS